MQFGKWFFGMVALAAVLTVSAPTGASAQQVYNAAQVTEKPRIASPMAAQKAILAAYPSSLQSAGVEGKVVVALVVQADGKVDASSVAVQSSDDSRLEGPAKEAVAGIQFVPGEVDGSPVATKVMFPISFVAR